MAPRYGIALFLCMLSALRRPCDAAPQNVTLLLNTHPDYSTFNRLLSDYGVAQHINSRTTLTVLCPPNSVLDPFLATLGSSPDRQSIYDVLSFHVLLDYKDLSMLSSLPRGSSLFTTLFQTTGLAAGNNGFLNITVDRTTGKPVARLPGISAVIDGSLELFPYNISLLSVGKVLVPTGVIGSPASPPVNVTLLLSQAGNVSRFLSLLISSGVDKIYQNHVTPPGLTIFAPSDAAFGRLAPKLAADLGGLSGARLQALLEGHALTSFYQEQELASASAPLATLAGGAVSIAFSGVVHTIDAGGSKANVTSSQTSNFPVSIFMLDNVLFSKDLLAAGSASPAPSIAAPSPTRSSSPLPSPAPSSSSLPSPVPSASVPPTSSPAASAPIPAASPPLSATPAPSPTPSTPSAPAASPPAPSPEGIANGPAALSPISPPASSSPSLRRPLPSLFLALYTVVGAFIFP